MTAFQDAIRDVAARANALSGMGADAEMVEIEGDVVAMTRKLLNGFVPLDETELVLDFLGQLTDAALFVVTHSRSLDSIGSSVYFMMAQVLAVGAAAERRS